MKQRWGLDRNVLRPTPGDPWGVEQHHWNAGAKENQQLNPGGPSNRQKSSGTKYYADLDLSSIYLFIYYFYVVQFLLKRFKFFASFKIMS